MAIIDQPQLPSQPLRLHDNQPDQIADSASLNILSSSGSVSKPLNIPEASPNSPHKPSVLNMVMNEEHAHKGFVVGSIPAYVPPPWPLNMIDKLKTPDGLSVNERHSPFHIQQGEDEDLLFEMDDEHNTK